MATAAPPNAHEVRQTLKEIQKNLQCPICLEVLSDPHNTLCGHSYCKECICTAISSSKRPKCPLCKEVITKRSLRKNERLSEIVEAVDDLEQAIIADTGITRTPPKPVPRHSGVTGTPGVRLHSTLHPTPLKPRPLGGGQSERDTSGCGVREVGEVGERENGIDTGPSASTSRSSSGVSRRKRKLSQDAVGDLHGEASSSSQPQIRNGREMVEDVNQQDDDPVDLALLEALNGATLRVPDSYPDDSDCETSLPNLRQRPKRRKDRVHQGELCPSVHSNHNQLRERKKSPREREGHSDWLIPSDSEDEEVTAPVLKTAALLLPNNHPFMSVSTTPTSKQLAEGAESECHPRSSFQTTAPCDGLREKSSAAGRGVSRVRRREKKHRTLKQAPLELFCK